MQNRIKNAIEFLKDGQSYLINGLRLGVDKFGIIEVTGWSQYKVFENITKGNSLEDLKAIKSDFNDMLDASSDLKSFIAKKHLRYNLWFDDYGKGSIEICSEIDNQIKWSLNL